MRTAKEAASNARVLIVDDDLDWREALGQVISGDGASCELVSSANEALDVLARESFDLVICDVRMDGMNGLELLDRVRGTQPSLPFIVVTALSGVPDAVDAMKRGAFDYAVKPCDADALREMVVGAVGARRRPRSEVCLRPVPSVRPPPVEELIGPGAAMSRLRAAIDRVAASSAPALVTGETGVGKELVARAIHARGERRQRPFIAVNASAVQPDLFESEVFGHLRGAFTGAAQSRKGLLTEAHGGTFFLDEIGDMPMSMQSKLLRVLQFGEIRPVGSDKTHSVDVRVVAATHRDMPALLRDGRFREDLYFRLNVLPVFVPPLRERREDIPALAAHFLEEARQRAPHCRVKSISSDALRVLTDAPWPGNIRELASAIERAVVFADDEILKPHHLSSIACEGAPVLPWQPTSHHPPWTLRRLNQAYAQWVLAQTGGDKQRCAEILGIDLSTLYRWQRAEHGVQASAESRISNG
ncbi:MAG: sigma-54 dependent transcriptional regulator [Myxococcota bacterium]|nr:sigma-54 dependent transcriptional regulator [Myxococcota bacterium]